MESDPLSLRGDQGFEGRQCLVITVGLIRIKGRTVEFSDLVAFDETEEGAGLELETAQFHKHNL